MAAGAVYASEQAACLLVAAAPADFSCDYVGNVVLPKAFGTAALYRLRHAEELE